MDVNINVIGQKLKIASNLKNYVEGTQRFVKFIFSFRDNTWDDMLITAQFQQNDHAYNTYLDSDNAVYLPKEITVGRCKLLLFGSKTNVKATTSYIDFDIDANYVVQNASSVALTTTEYDKLVTDIANKLVDKVVVEIPTGVEMKANKTQTLNDASTADQYPSAKEVWRHLTTREKWEYKVDSLDGDLADNAYPTARCVKAELAKIASLPVVNNLEFLHYANLTDKDIGDDNTLAQQSTTAKQQCESYISDKTAFVYSGDDSDEAQSPYYIDINGFTKNIVKGHIYKITKRTSGLYALNDLYANYTFASNSPSMSEYEAAEPSELFTEAETGQTYKMYQIDSDKNVDLYIHNYDYKDYLPVVTSLKFKKIENGVVADSQIFSRTDYTVQSSCSGWHYEFNPINKLLDANPDASETGNQYLFVCVKNESESNGYDISDSIMVGKDISPSETASVCAVGGYTIEDAASRFRLNYKLGKCNSTVAASIVKVIKDINNCSGVLAGIQRGLLKAQLATLLSTTCGYSFVYTDTDYEDSEFPLQKGHLYEVSPSESGTKYGITDITSGSGGNNSGNSGDAATLSKIWVALGDSKTDFNNNGVNRPDNYPYWIQQRNPKITLQNLGSAGGMITNERVETAGSSTILYPSIYTKATQITGTPDIITVAGGYNDWNWAVTLGTFTTDISGYDTSTAANVPSSGATFPLKNTFYTGVFRLAKYLTERFPTTPILWITPFPTTSKNNGGANGWNVCLPLSDYVQAIKDVCAYFSIPVCDMYTAGGLTPFTSSNLSTYWRSSDGVHPNGEGSKIYSYKIERMMRQTYQDWGKTW